MWLEGMMRAGYTKGVVGGGHVLKVAYINLLANLTYCIMMKTSFRPAPMAQTSQAWPCLRCRSQLARGMPPGPPGTHV